MLYIIPMKSDADQLLLDKACHIYWSVRLNYVRCLLVLELLLFKHRVPLQSFIVARSSRMKCELNE